MINVKHLIKKDDNGRVTAEMFTSEDYDCVKIRYQYDERGNLSERLASYCEYSIKTKYCYDSEKRLVSEYVSEYIEEFYNDKNIASYENKYVYDSDGNLLKKIKGRVMSTVNYTYSDDKKPVKKEIIFSDGDKNICDFIYDSSGRVTLSKSITNDDDRLYSETKIFYDSDGNVVKEITTDSNNKQIVTDFVYKNGLEKKRTVSYSDTMFKREFIFEHDSKDRKSKQIYINKYGERITTQFFYDEFDNEIFAFVYDDENHLIEKCVFKDSVETWQYAAYNGKPIKHTHVDHEGKRAQYECEYDKNGNVVKDVSRYRNGEKSCTESFYDDNNNLIKHIVTATDGNSVVHQYEYDSTNTLIEESLTDADGKTVVWKYSHNSNGETRVEIDNSENANYDIDLCGDLFPKWD